MQIDKEIETDILKLISTRFPYSYETVETVYYYVKSFDNLIFLLDYCTTHAHQDPIPMAYLFSKPESLEPLINQFLKKWES